MSYNNVALAVIPSGIKSSIVYSLIGGNMTFARGSSATRINKDGLIEYVDTSVPRLDYDGAIPHLLLEPDRSNLIAYSEDFDFWTQNAAFTEYFNYDIAPDGNKTADRLLNTSGLGKGYYRTATGTTIASSDYTFSVFAKGLALTKRLRLELNAVTFGSTSSLFDLENGTILNEINCTSKIESYRDGWYRLSITANSDNTNAIVPAIYAPDTNDVLIWGAQLELGSYATSYIPRLDFDIATRSADTCDSGTGDFNSNEGVLFVEIQGLSDTYTANRYITLSDGTTNNMLYIRYSNTGELDITNVGPSLGSSVYSTNLDLSQRHKIAVKYGTQTSDYKVYINGSSVTISGSFSAQLMTGLDTLDFSYPTGSLQFYGKVRQAVVFNSGLTDTQLAELTR